ncbi:MAG: protein kinase [Myxococcota bacterium]
MRIVVRIVCVFLALPLVVAGVFGLLAAYLPDGPITYDFRVALRHLIDFLPAGSLSEDAPVATEAWLRGPLVRFAVGPCGFALLVLGLLPWPEAKGKRKSGAKGEEAEPDLPPVDKGVARLAKKEAGRLVKQGQVFEAAETLFNAGLLDKSAELFCKAGVHERAAEIRHEQKRFIEAAEFYAEAGNHDAAGSVFAKQEEWARAAQSYVKAGKNSVAAEMYEQAGDFRRAGDCYEKAEFLRHAAQAYIKCKAWPRAARCLEAVCLEEGVNAGSMDPKKQAELKKLVLKTGKLYQRAQQPDKAIEILEKGGCSLEAAEIAATLKDHSKAAGLFKAAGKAERAAEALQHLGKDQEAAQVLGEHHRDQGDSLEAAQQLEKAGDFMAAGDLYRSLENFERAAECFAAQKDFAQAAEMFEQAQDPRRAGECYERAGRFNQAAECYARSGSTEREGELLEKAGEFLRAGEAYHRDGEVEKAIGVLQKVEAQSEGFVRAAALLGDIFQARGQHSLAMAKLERALSGQELSAETLPLYYSLATSYEGNDSFDKALRVYEKVLAFDYQFRDVEQRLANVRAALDAQGTATEQASAQSASTQGASTQGQPGRYQIEAELGRGGMGIVYRAKDTVLDRIVAYKVLPDTLKENPQALQNFLREAKAAAKLNHPNIVTVYDTGEQDGRYYIAMEFVDGTTLKEIVKQRGPVPLGGLVHVIAQLCEALAFAHEKKVVHRDIKPANMMWTREKQAKIMDFGLARVVEEVRNHTTVVSGTPYYMSPEQTVGKNIDHRTDLYSLGITIFELATATLPFKEGNIPYHHLHTPPPDIREIRPDLPQGLAAIVERCLKKDPNERYATAREILAEISASLG